MLETAHITKSDLAGLVVSMAKEGELEIGQLGSRQRMVKDDQWIHAPDDPAGQGCDG